MENEHFVKTYIEASNIPSITSATILPSKVNETLCIHSNWTAQDLNKLEKTCFSKNYSFDSKTFSVLSTTMPYDISSVLKQAFSQSGKKQAIIRETKSKDLKEGIDLEIWNEYKKEKTFELTDHEEHGKVNTNAFSCLAWSSDEKYLLYTAEAKRAKSSSYFKVSKGKDETGNKDPTNQGEEYIYREEWGEDFAGSHHSVLAILDIETGKVNIVSGDSIFNEQISIGGAIWGPEDKTIVFLGFNEFPRRLGVRSCTNRRSAIYAYDCQTSNIECISSKENVSVRCPRFTRDFKYLLYLEEKMGGPHMKSSKLQKCTWETKDITTIVETVDCPEDNEFPGLYVKSIPQQCWYQNFMFLNSDWRSFSAILCININDGSVQKILTRIPLHPDSTEESFGASTVLDVKNNFILAELSSLDIEPCLVIGRIKIGNKVSIEWKYLDEIAPIKHSEINWKIVKMNEGKQSFEFIFVTPATSERKEKCSAIIRAHGGPHCAYSPGFSKDILAFTKLNYINCLVNYQGSTGFGECNLHSLPGKVGKIDILDVQQVAEWVKNSSGLTISNSFILGGSHGGFIGAHLIGQYPDFYSAAILLNPVIDMAGMSETSDIPDWIWVEGGCGDIYDPSAIINEKHMKSMWEKSPIRYGENVKTPVLLLLGSKDKRVPYYQGLKYYHLLKARNVPVRAYVYEDGHSLQKTPHNADVFMQTLLWLEKYSSK